MWNPTSIEPHVKSDPARTVYRVLPPEHLLSSQLASGQSEVSAGLAAMRQQRSTGARPEILERYDDTIAFVLKYPEVQGDGRFSRSQDSYGTLYAAYDYVTALSERAFHQLRFHEAQGGNAADALTPTAQIAFNLNPIRVVDLALPPFANDARLSSPVTQYAYTQDFADAVRDTAALGIVYPSVRDLNHGSNIALLSYLGLATMRLDRRRVRDWHMRCDVKSRTVTMQTTAGTTARFCFDAHGQPVAL